MPVEWAQLSSRYILKEAERRVEQALFQAPFHYTQEMKAVKGVNWPHPAYTRRLRSRAVAARVAAQECERRHAIKKPALARS
jgi:hypothetical protein